jgi:DNA-dependent RNA polymerase auxiliary subunit epsilon
MGFVRTLYLLAFLIIFSGSATAQSYRILSPDDFRGVPQRDGLSVAATACYIDLKYDVHARNNIYQLKFHVELIVDEERSWIDHERVNTPGMLAEILKHEQGHYNINYIEQQELLRELESRQYTDNYKEEVSAIFDRIHAKYDQLNKDYDDDTENSRNRKQQASWDRYFQRRLGSVLASR